MTLSPKIEYRSPSKRAHQYPARNLLPSFVRSSIQFSPKIFRMNAWFVGLSICIVAIVCVIGIRILSMILVARHSSIRDHDISILKHVARRNKLGEIFRFRSDTSSKNKWMNKSAGRMHWTYYRLSTLDSVKICGKFCTLNTNVRCEYIFIGFYHLRMAFYGFAKDKNMPALMACHMLDIDIVFSRPSCIAWNSEIMMKYTRTHTRNIKMIRKPHMSERTITHCYVIQALYCRLFIRLYEFVNIDECVFLFVWTKYALCAAIRFIRHLLWGKFHAETTRVPRWYPRIMW